jgi:hypothetical protein
MNTEAAQRGSYLLPAVEKSLEILDQLVRKYIVLKPGADIPPEDRIEPVDSIRAGVGAKFLAQDGVSPETLARLSIYVLRVLFDVYQGTFRGTQLLDYIGRVPASSILLGEGFKQLVDQGMAPSDALNTTLWRLRGTEPAVRMPPNLALNAEASGDEPGGQPGGSGTRLGANPPDPAAAADLAAAGVNAGDSSTAAARPAGSAVRSDPPAQALRAHPERPRWRLLALRALRAGRTAEPRRRGHQRQRPLFRRTSNGPTHPNLADSGAYDIRLAARLYQSGLIGSSRSR